ncbi:MAG TPA: hypothetical protein VNJ71_05005 [Gemmatimonadales bacterium]|nr:hypothetical protein [Gemmatimonadales bacterium]
MPRSCTVRRLAAGVAAWWVLGVMACQSGAGSGSITPPPDSIPPFPPPAQASCANRPAGYRIIWDEEWDVVPGSWTVYGGAGRLALLQDPTAPASGPNVFRGRFPAGMPGGVGPYNLERQFGRDVSELYVCVVAWISPNWTDNGNTGTKFFWWETPYAGTAQSLGHYANLTPRLGLNLQSAGGILNRNMFANFNMIANAGRWHAIEYLVRGNTAPANGTLTIWVDGTRVAQETDVTFFYPGQAPRFQALRLNPTYGGGLNPVPYDLDLRIDRWVVAAP